MKEQAGGGKKKEEDKKRRVCLPHVWLNIQRVQMWWKKNRQRGEMKDRHARRGLGTSKQKCLNDLLGERQRDAQFRNSVDLT